MIRRRNNSDWLLLVLLVVAVSVGSRFYFTNAAQTETPDTEKQRQRDDSLLASELAAAPARHPRNFRRPAGLDADEKPTFDPDQEKPVSQRGRDYWAAYRKLAANDPAKGELERACQALASNVRGDGAWDYKNGLVLLRQSRSQAAVPLLLWALAEDPGTALTAFDDGAVTLGILTGDPTYITGDEHRRKAVLKTWKGPVKTDLDKFTPEQAEFLASLLLVDTPRLWEPAQVLRPAELSPVLVEPFLKLCSDDTWRSGARVALAELRRAGKADQLDRVVKDPKRTAAARAGAAVALAKAGEPFPVNELQSMLESSGDVSTRVLLAESFGLCKEAGKVEDALLLCLEDKNSLVRSKAAKSLAHLRLTTRLEDALIARVSLSSGEELHWVAHAASRTPRSVDALAAALEANLDDPGTCDALTQVLARASHVEWRSLAGNSRKEVALKLLERLKHTKRG
jgi:hypothetical protein